MMHMLLLFNLAFIIACCHASAPLSSTTPFRQLTLPIVVGVRRASMSRNIQRRHTAASTTYSNIDISTTANPKDVVSTRGGAAMTSGKPPVKLLRWAYAAAGLATTSAWGTMVYTTIRDNQPAGAMMPCELLLLIYRTSFIHSHYQNLHI